MKNRLCIPGTSNHDEILNSGNGHESSSDTDIKLSREGYLLYANADGINFLRFINFFTGVPAIRYLLQEYPYILDVQNRLDLNIAINQTLIDAAVKGVQNEVHIKLHANKPSNEKAQ